MEFDEYQEQSIASAIYPDKGNNFPYTVLGLCGEAGEVADKTTAGMDTRDAVHQALDVCAAAGRVAEHVKKALRDDGGRLTESRRGKINDALRELIDEAISMCVYIGDDPFLERDNFTSADADLRRELGKELTDNLWYNAAGHTELKLSMNETAEACLQKVLDRKARGVLQGSGDNR